MKGLKSIHCLTGKHKKCVKLGMWGYHSVLTGLPVEEKGKCICSCHIPDLESIRVECEKPTPLGC